jgi:hypothetical protein
VKSYIKIIIIITIKALIRKHLTQRRREMKVLILSTVTNSKEINHLRRISNIEKSGTITILVKEKHIS